MKIVHIITTINRGGAENQIVQMISEQKKDNLDISLIFLKGNGYWKEYLEDQDVLCLGPIFEKGNYFSLSSLFKFQKILKKYKFNILHIHMPPPLLIINFLKMIFGNFSKIIFTSHNDEPFLNIPIIDRILVPLLLNNVEKIICISKAVKIYLIKRYFLKEKKIEVIPYGFNPIFYKSQKVLNKEELHYIDNEKIYIGTVARLVNQKRIDLLIESFSILKKISNADFRLVILGDGNLRRKLLKFSISKGVYESIIWIPYTENVISHIKNWDVFCLTSRYEGFGLVLLEAIAAETPIVAMNSSSIRDIVGPCGKIVEFGNVSSFANNILETISNKSLYVNKSHLNNFTFKENLNNHLKIYKGKN